MADKVEEMWQKYKEAEKDGVWEGGIRRHEDIPMYEMCKYLVFQRSGGSGMGTGTQTWSWGCPEGPLTATT